MSEKAGKQRKKGTSVFFSVLWEKYFNVTSEKDRKKKRKKERKNSTHH